MEKPGSEAHPKSLKNLLPPFVDGSDLELLRGVLELCTQELDDQAQSGSGAGQLILLGSESAVQVSDGVVLTPHEVQHLRQRQEGDDEPGC